jgi:hypothetical protein
MIGRVNRLKTRTSPSAFPLNTQQIGFHINWEKIRSHLAKNQRLWDFYVFKVNGDKLIKLTYGKFPNGDYWFSDPDEDENENIFLYIRRRDSTNAYNDENGMNGTYVIWNSADRKGFVLDILESTTSIPMVDYNQFTSMPVEPYMATVEARISGRVEKILTLEVLREDESPIIEKEGGAKTRRGRRNEEESLDPVFNPKISASFLATKSPIRVYAEIKIDDSLLVLNNGNLITLEGTSEAKKKKVLNTTISKILAAKVEGTTTTPEEENSEEENSETEETENETENEDETQERSNSSEENAERQREADRIARESTERLAREAEIQRANEEEEKNDRNMKIAAAAILVVGIGIIIYRKRQQKIE